MSEVTATAIQQDKPNIMGRYPFFSSSGKFVFRPIALIAIIIMNFPMADKFELRTAGIGVKVLITDATIKPITNQGNVFTMLNPFSSALLFFADFRAQKIARINVIGTIISVLVSFTIVAKASAVSFPTWALHAAPAATTDEVSLIAVPAHMPKPISDRSSALPRGGNRNTAIILNKNIVDMDSAISLSSAEITGAVAAIAEPPHMDVPTPIRIEVFP